MAPPKHKGSEEARKELPALVAAAEKGQITVITRHGRGVAALVPLEDVSVARQRGLLMLAGTGHGLWGNDTANAIRTLRNEWKR